MSNLNLMLHCGGHQVERADLDKVTAPAASGIWHPINHNVLVEEVLGALDTAGLEVRNVAHALARNGAHYFGIMELGSDKADFTTVLGLRNSHDKSFSAQLVVGSGVFVCDNLAFSGEIKIGRKHTKQILRDLPGLVIGAVNRIPLMQVHQEQQIRLYKEQQIDHYLADHLIMEMFREDVIPPSKIRQVWNEWAEPSYIEFTEGGDTAWRLFNAVTETLKGRLGDLPARTQRLHTIIDGVCEEVLPEAA